MLLTIILLLTQPHTVVGVVLLLGGLTSLSLLIVCLNRAPIGYQDKNGFHYGSEPED
jgi:hypothetical protein